MMADKRYTLTIYVAAPGTPLFDKVTGGRTQEAYGFAPPKGAEKFHWWSTEMPGNVEKDGHKAYRNPIYTRTMEISERQIS